MHEKSNPAGLIPALSLPVSLAERRTDVARAGLGSTGDAQAAGTVVTLLGPSLTARFAAPSNEPPDLTA